VAALIGPSGIETKLLDDHVDEVRALIGPSGIETGYVWGKRRLYRPL